MEPHALPAPYPSNEDNSVLYLICPVTPTPNLSAVVPTGICIDPVLSKITLLVNVATPVKFKSSSSVNPSTSRFAKILSLGVSPRTILPSVPAAKVTTPTKNEFPSTRKSLPTVTSVLIETLFAFRFILFGLVILGVPPVLVTI